MSREVPTFTPNYFVLYLPKPKMHLFDMNIQISVCALLCFVAHLPIANGSTKALEEMFERMTSDTLIFAKYLESLLLTQDARCSAIRDCSEANYDSCVSEFPFMECPGEDFSYPILSCGSSKEGGCGGFFDFTTSKVSLAPSIRTSLGEDEDSVNNVKDAVCWTLAAEEEMIRLYNEAKGYWDAFSVSPPVFFFGADNGVFRQYPASECMRIHAVIFGLSIFDVLAVSHTEYVRTNAPYFNIMCSYSGR